MAIMFGQLCRIRQADAESIDLHYKFMLIVGRRGAR